LGKLMVCDKGRKWEKRFFLLPLKVSKTVHYKVW
jgi:hypothetical protein